jgi:hypothetical protein
MMLLCASQIAIAQDTINVNTPPREIERQNTTSIVNVNPLPAPEETNSIVRRRISDPMKATMLSVVFPGGGQIYNHLQGERKYWKLPLIYAGFGALFYAIKVNSDNHQSHYKAYIHFTDDLPTTVYYVSLLEKLVPYWSQEDYDPMVNPNAPYATMVKDYLFSSIDYYKRNRDLSMILTGVAYLAQILWANVDASLMNFNIDSNLTLSPTLLNTPAGMQTVAGVNIRFKF